MYKIIHLLAPTSFVLLSACMGSSDSSYGPSLTFGDGNEIAKSGGVGSGPLSIGQSLDVAIGVDALADAIIAETYDVPNVAPTGNFAMTGYMALAPTESEDILLIGNLTLQGSFDGALTNSSAGDFREFNLQTEEQFDYAGTLEIAGTVSDNLLQGTMGGILTSDSLALEIAADMEGVLFDVEGTNTFVGGVEGNVGVNDGAVDNPIEGAFVAF